VKLKLDWAVKMYLNGLSWDGLYNKSVQLRIGKT
jgi:hypothetical protein